MPAAILPERPRRPSGQIGTSPVFALSWPNRNGSGASAQMRGLLWCLTFLVLDAAQAVFFGAAFQRSDSFLAGALVFGVPAAGCIVAHLALLRPDELRSAWRKTGDLVGLNVTSAGAWLAYLIAIQLIEPAVAFAIFSGTIPLAAPARAGVRQRGGPRRRETRPKRSAAWCSWPAWRRLPSSRSRAGPASCAEAPRVAAARPAAGGARRRADRRHAGLQRPARRAGVGPLAQFGLRFPLYTVLALAGYRARPRRQGWRCRLREFALILFAGLAAPGLPHLRRAEGGVADLGDLRWPPSPQPARWWCSPCSWPTAASPTRPPRWPGS